MNLARESFDYGGHRAMALRPLKADSIPQHTRLDSKTGPHEFRNRARSFLARGFKEHYVASNGRLQLRR